MKPKSFPFLSPASLITALVFLIGLGAVWAWRGGNIFSPGALSARDLPMAESGGFSSHASFAKDCQQCHNPVKSKQDALCLNCHQDVAQQLGSENGLHSVFESQTCAGCHPDHRGAEFDAAQYARDRYDHTHASFSLANHTVNYDNTPLSCAECHPASITSFDLDTCVTCHADYDAAFMEQHRQDYGSSCLTCHNGVDNLVDFNHALVFPLSGGHAGLDCKTCHNQESFAGLSSECATCHEKDRPAEHYPGDCVTCHTINQWQEITFNHADVAGATDCQTCHERPAEHYNGQCSACHTTDAWLPASFDHDVAGATDCQTCHEPPQNHYPGQCSACHTTNAWSPATFDHATAGATDCQSCHARPENHWNAQCSACHNTDAWLPASFNHSAAGATDCQSCHARPSGHYGGQCSACHSTNAWRPASFDHGAAGATDCQSCHAPPSGHYSGQCSSCHSTNNWNFNHSDGTDCQSCHRRPSEHSGGQCSNCHSTSSWDADDDNGGGGGEDDD